MFLGCIAGFIVSIVKSNGFAPVEQNPMIGPTAAALIASGAKVTPLIVGGDWWRLVSPMWLHAGVIHIATNLNMLYRVGFAFERGIGCT
jgi:membrane associated rhomboid family serine protease